MSLLNYKSEISQSVFASAQEIEETRQALCRGEVTPKTLAYARFLSACANAASFSHGARKKFLPDSDEHIAREWPFLKPLLKHNDQAKEPTDD